MFSCGDKSAMSGGRILLGDDTGISEFLKDCWICFFAGIKQQWVEEEYCWVITQVALRLRCGPSGSSVSEFGVLSGRPSMYTYSWPIAYSISTCAKIRLATDLPKRNHYITRALSTFGKMHTARSDKRKVPGFAPGQQIHFPIIYTIRFESQLGTCIPDRYCSRSTSFPPQSNPLSVPPEQTTIVSNVYCLLVISYRRSQWPRGLGSRSAAARLLRLWVRIPPDVWMFVCCECYVLSDRGLCDELITPPEESYRLWCVVLCDLETSWLMRPWPAWGRSATRKTN